MLGHDFEEMEATVGVEFGYLEVKDVDRDDPNVGLSVQLWDTCKSLKKYIIILLAGAERYRSITTR